VKGAAGAGMRGGGRFRLMRQGTFHPILDNLHPTHIAVPASATFACLLPAYRLQLLTLGSVTTSPTHQDTSGVTTLEWLAWSG
jgi:hypothetical protein